MKLPSKKQKRYKLPDIDFFKGEQSTIASEEK